MIFFDVTKSATAGHRSGLTRVSARLREELGAQAVPVRWDQWDREAGPGDWFFTAELFSEAERPGFAAFLQRHQCRTAALFHDAIPLKHPHITWPQSVGRHPEYLKRLASFDRVWAVSRASREELIGYWSWLGLDKPPPVNALALGADFDGSARIVRARAATTAQPDLPALLCVGIIEPRKNQDFLLNVCDDLWSGGKRFVLHLVGRVNPHFGSPIVRRIAALRKRHPTFLRFHESATDAELAALYAGARACVFPTIAEGCGLPLLEALWRGVPCVCSDLPVLRENADAGGCVTVPVNDRHAWGAALGRLLGDEQWHERLVKEATTRPLPTWAGAAHTIAAGLH